MHSCGLYCHKSTKARSKKMRNTAYFLHKDIVTPVLPVQAVAQNWEVSCCLREQGPPWAVLSEDDMAGADLPRRYHHRHTACSQNCHAQPEANTQDWCAPTLPKQTKL